MGTKRMNFRTDFRILTNRKRNLWNTYDILVRHEWIKNSNT